jgi:cyclopropane fatty-acyl-phospholipid synthase-like methyltransferase
MDMEEYKGLPPALEFYTRYYRATRDSAAYAEFCRRLFGANYAQHGFADMAQLDLLLSKAQLQPGERVLELGCGNGGMAEYIAGKTGAHVIGIDLIPEAIRQASRRKDGSTRLDFLVADIAQLPFVNAAFDVVIAIDTLYFGELPALVCEVKRVLVAGGRLATLYTHGADPQVPIAVFPRETLPADRTPVADAFRQHGMVYQAWDESDADARHAQLKLQVLHDLREAFEQEGTMFLFENRIGEAEGVREAVEADCLRRYLFVARNPM